SVAVSCTPVIRSVPCFFFSHPPTTDIYPLSLHDALPILRGRGDHRVEQRDERLAALEREPLLADELGLQEGLERLGVVEPAQDRSEEHTSELQSRENLVCRLLLEKKKNRTNQRREVRA